MNIKKQIDAMDHWELMERILGFQVDGRKMYNSPVREGDVHPSFGLYRDERTRQAKWKDFAYEGGDVYSLAMHMYRCDFSNALRKVAQLAGLLDGSPGTRRPPKLNVRKIIEHERAVCSFEPREFTKCDHDYWTVKYGVTPVDLDRFRIRPAQVFRMLTSNKKEQVYVHNQWNPIYVMEIGDKGHLKMYRPLHHDRKWKYIGNTDRMDVFGEHLLDPGDERPVVFSAGQKDGMVMSIMLDVVPLAFNGESVMLEDKDMFQLFMKCSGPMWSLYDNDRTGERYSKKLCDRHPMIKQVRLGAFTDLKDFSDLAEARDMSAIQKIKTIIHTK